MSKPLKYFVLYKEFNSSEGFDLVEFHTKDKATDFLLRLDPKYHVRILEVKELHLVKKSTIE